MFSLPPPFSSTIAPRYANSSTSFTSWLFTTILSLFLTNSVLSVLLLSSSWSNPWPIGIRILTLRIPALLLTKSWTSLISQIRRLRSIQTLRICPLALSPSCAVFHSSPWCSTIFLRVPNRGLFSKSPTCVCRLALQSFACSKMFF